MTRRRLLWILPVLLLAGLPAVAGQCPSCRVKAHTKDIGTCKVCGASTQSGQFALCMDCSERLQDCEWCRAALPATPLKTDGRPVQTYTQGRWTYRFEIVNGGTRSEGFLGTLTYAGRPLPEPAAVNDFVRTPWGPVYWVGHPATGFGGHGWMLRRKPSRPEGSPVAPPLQTGAKF